MLLDRIIREEIEEITDGLSQLYGRFQPHGQQLNDDPYNVYYFVRDFYKYFPLYIRELKKTWNTFRSYCDDYGVEITWKDIANMTSEQMLDIIKDHKDNVRKKIYDALHNFPAWVEIHKAYGISKIDKDQTSVVEGALICHFTDNLSGILNRGFQGNKNYDNIAFTRGDRYTRERARGNKGVNFGTIVDDFISSKSSIDYGNYGLFFVADCIRIYHINDASYEAMFEANSVHYGIATKYFYNGTGHPVFCIRDKNDNAIATFNTKVQMAEYIKNNWEQLLPSCGVKIGK